jgi:RNA polymerase sigma-70 factor (ECF subfamily)
MPATRGTLLVADDPPLHTTQLHHWLRRMRDGDTAARDELLRTVCGQLERLAHKMLRAFPNVRCWAETNDVLQNAMLRLLRSLKKIEPPSVRDFFALAATEMRRELLDLARHFAQANRAGAAPGGASPGDSSATPEAPAPAEDSDELERWRRFHEAAEQLPVKEREVVSLIFYHGKQQAEVAEVLDVTVRTVQRRWETAMGKLQAVLRGE